MALPNAKILIHQVSGGFSGQAADIEIHAREIIDIRRKLDEIIAKHTKQPLEKVSQDTDRDYFMSAEEAKEYNIIDRVITRALRRALDGRSESGRTSARDLIARSGLTCIGSRIGRGTDIDQTDRLERTASLQLLRQVAAPGQEADRRPGRLHLRRVHRSLQRDHRRGARRRSDVRRREPAEAEGDLLGPERVRRRAGEGEAHALGRGLQPLQAHPDRALRRATARSSCRSRTSCCSARPAAARRCSRRRWPGSSTCRSRSPTRRR